MNILIAILKLLLGLSDEAPAPPPRRRIRPSSPASSRPESAPEARPAGVEDMLRRFFDEVGLDGGEGEERRSGLPPRPGSGVSGEEPESFTKVAETPPPAVRPSPAALSAFPEKAAVGLPVPVESAYPPSAALAAQARVPAAAAVRPKSGGLPEPAAVLAARLRGNPGAGREAFIYSEIFGRPLADRPGGVG